MQDEPAEEVAFPPLTLDYIGYFIYYDASGRIKNFWSIKPALSARMLLW